MKLLTGKISNFVEEHLGLSGEAVYELFKKHGTTLCGLVKEGHLREDQVDEFLETVHDVPLDFGPDPELRAMLAEIKYPRWVFTASTPSHAKRCLKALGIEDMFCGIISASSKAMINQVGYVSKHDPRCFAQAMEMAGVPPEKASGCIFFDDSLSNLRTAKQMGWHTVLVGLHARDTDAYIGNDPAADVAVDSIHQIRSACPELFKTSHKKIEDACPELFKTSHKKIEDADANCQKRDRARILKPCNSSPVRRVRRKASELESPARAAN
jgi:putative hydrolase of the HAD superfamily/pyrimidine and pyridine-specific 5'-nucleotidase